jgi:hypothetical protein
MLAKPIQVNTCLSACNTKYEEHADASQWFHAHANDDDAGLIVFRVPFGNQSFHFVRYR